MKNILLSFVGCCFLSASGQLPSLQWVRGTGGTYTETCRALCVDGSGNVYTAGCFSVTADFDPGPGIVNLTSQGDIDMFILKLDQNGNFSWVKQISGIHSQYAYAIKTDASGNIYVAGEFTGTSDFDPGPGVFNLSTTFNVNPIAFILKLDVNGNFAWANQVGDINQGTPVVRDLDLDPSGNPLLAGIFRGTRDFDPGPGVYTLTTNASASAYVLKLNPNGNFVWAASLTGTACLSFAQSIRTDMLGNIYVGGYFYNSGDFDPGPAVLNLSSSGVNDAFISKLDVNGNLVWAKQFGGSGQSIINGLAIDCMANIYCGGMFDGIFDTDPGPANNIMNAIGSGDIFLSKLDFSGNFIWGKQMGGAALEYVNKLATDAFGDVYATGFYESSPADFDPGPGTYTLGSAGAGDIFLAKLNNAGDFAWAFAPGSAGINETGWDITTDTAYNVYAAGNFSLTVDFDPAAGVSNLTSAGGLDNFVLKLSQATPTVPMPIPTPLSVTVCPGSSATFSATATGFIGWYLFPTTPLPIGSGSLFTTPPVYNTTVYYVENQICYFPSTRATVTVDILPAPGVSVTTTSPVLCKGMSRILTASGAQSYTWSNNTTNSVTTVTPAVGVSIYSVTGTGANGCTATASIALTAFFCMGFESPSSVANDDLFIYPNPGLGTFKILTNRDLDIKISNENGQILKTISVIAGETSLPLSDLSAGIYFVSVVNSAVKPQKIIISH